MSTGRTDEPPAPRRPSFWDAFRDPRLALMVGLGFSSGLPSPVNGTTLGAWLDDAGVSLAAIGLFAWVQFPANFKFVWAPLLDRFRLPFLGRRRGWALLTQLLLLGSIGLMGSLAPDSQLFWIAVVAVWVAFLGASQDIVLDAYRTDLLPAEERASGTAIWVAAYRGALIVATSGALLLGTIMPWSSVYWVLAALILVGIGSTLLAPSPPAAQVAPRTLGRAVVKPFTEFLRRDHALWFLVFILLYRVGDILMGGNVFIPFLRDVGFDDPTSALAKGVGMGATIFGTLLGGGLVAKWGLRRSLFVFGILQAVANGLYALLALAGPHAWMLIGAVGFDNVMNGMGTAAFVALLMTLCNKRYTATQFALFSSLMTLPGRLLAGGSGWLAAEAGWPVFFLVTIVFAVPALVIVFSLPIPEPRRPDVEALEDLDHETLEAHGERARVRLTEAGVLGGFRWPVGTVLELVDGWVRRATAPAPVRLGRWVAATDTPVVLDEDGEPDALTLDAPAAVGRLPRGPGELVGASIRLEAGARIEDGAPSAGRLAGAHRVRGVELPSGSRLEVVTGGALVVELAAPTTVLGHRVEAGDRLRLRGRGAARAPRVTVTPGDGSAPFHLDEKGLRTAP
ncbi:MAG TPA: AmpG family muropeptide MFS transporter [Sandaracinaceae bacterium LLY-WYZ-13_1]|nr:AmpG family muropeptide MFS transporter [Sandaracinaceae bacterium LLY-WYZ-13_1]